MEEIKNEICSRLLKYEEELNRLHSIKYHVSSEEYNNNRENYEVAKLKINAKIEELKSLKKQFFFTETDDELYYY